MFTTAELQIINDALDAKLASNKRFQRDKPEFHEIFMKIETDILAVRNKCNTAKEPTKK